MSPATQSSSTRLLGNLASAKGSSPIRKDGKNSGRISCSATSVLVMNQDLIGKARASSRPAGPLKTSQSRTKNVFAKFQGVLYEHFAPKKVRASGNSNNIKTKSGRGIAHADKIQHGRQQDNASLPPLTQINQNAVSKRLQNQREAMNMQKQKVRSLTGTIEKMPQMSSKRVEKVDEGEFQNSHLADDPFSDTSSGRHSNQFEARLRSTQENPDGVNITDPFQVENILNTSVDAILTTPPVGCSTPRPRSRCSSRCSTPSESRVHSDERSELDKLTPVKTSQKQKPPATNRNSRAWNTGTGSLANGKLSNGKRAPVSQNGGLQDSTRLSSFPPGSTIRRVPRSMARLKDEVSVPATAIERQIHQRLAMKKHPSPCKGDLEMFGQYMEKNLASGFFRDSDELGMSFSSPQVSSAMLSPRDTNRLVARDLTGNSANYRKDFVSRGAHAGLPTSRSRIPKPVKQFSSPRADTVVARDFYPVNKGECTMDELQWDASEYKIGHHCNHCNHCGNISQGDQMMQKQDRS